MTVQKTQSNSEIALAAQCWDEYAAAHAHSATAPRLFWWEAGSEIQRNINSKISGNPDIDWIAHSVRTHFSGRTPLSNCLALGCGTGHLERAMAQSGVFQHCDAYDVSSGSIRVAQESAQAAGIDTIDYYVADVNTLVFEPAHYDAVWVGGAMHHFLALEHILAQIQRTLRPDGLLILNEYVGPNRFQFSQRQKEIGNLCLSLLPMRYRQLPQEALQGNSILNPLSKGPRWALQRMVDKTKDGDLIRTLYRRLRSSAGIVRHTPQYKAEVGFPSERDVIAADPSEAIRSSDILPLLPRYFSVVEKKDWGGNVLQFLLADIAGNFSDSDAESQILLRMLIEIEDTLRQCGEFESDFSYIVACPRHDVSSMAGLDPQHKMVFKDTGLI